MHKQLRDVAKPDAMGVVYKEMLVAANCPCKALRLQCSQSMCLVMQVVRHFYPMLDACFPGILTVRPALQSRQDKEKRNVQA